MDASVGVIVGCDFVMEVDRQFMSIYGLQVGICEAPCCYRRYGGVIA